MQTETKRQNSHRPLRISEAAALLGIHVKKLRELTDEGHIPSIKIPGFKQRLYDRDVLEAILRGAK